MNPGDIKLFYSGGANNSSGILSLGGMMSSQEIGIAVFDDLDARRLVYGVKDFRCLYLKNVSGAPSAAIHIKGFCSSKTELYLSLDISGIGGEASSIPDIYTTPSTAGLFYMGGVTIPALAVGAFHAFWVKRVPRIGLVSMPVSIEFIVTEGG